MVENENSICNNNTTQQLMHTPTFSQSNTDQSISLMYLPFHPCLPICSCRGQLLQLAAVMTSHLQRPSSPLTAPTQDAYLFIEPLNNFLTPPPIASQLELRPLYHHSPHCHLSLSNLKYFTSEPYLSRCYLKLLYYHSPHCHLSL